MVSKWSYKKMSFPSTYLLTEIDEFNFQLKAKMIGILNQIYFVFLIITS